MMITKRQFFVTMLVFLILLLLFMGFQLGKQAVSAAELRQPASNIGADPRRADRNVGFLTLGEMGMPDAPAERDDWILYVGSEDSSFAATVREWSGYARMPVALCGEMPEAEGSALPALVMIEPDYVSGCAEKLGRWMEQGVDVLFLALPDCGEVTADPTLQALLGISEIRQPQIRLQGIRLFKGFLLGGERAFEVKTAADEEKQDLELEIPWYSVRAGSKTYMRGILSDEDLRRARESKLKDEDLPAILWRHHYGSGEAYAVNGNYLENRRTGVGMLQAIQYERSDYALYPVVNARLFSIADFPMLTDENPEEVLQIYGKPVSKVQTDIVVPMLITLSTKYDVRPSCFLRVKYHRDAAQQPDRGLPGTWLSMMGEMDGELALTADPLASDAAGEALADLEYLRTEAPEYRFTSVYADCEGLSALSDLLEKADAKDVRTVSAAGDSEEYPIIGYLNETVTLQQAVDLRRHSFTDELELLGVQTALAYSNGYYDMAGAFYPRGEADEWQNASRRIFSNLTTYSAPFRMEDCLTAAESDRRIRTYFALSCDQVREGDVLTLTISGSSDAEAAYFILRTHDETIESMTGGTFTEIEENAYLITAGEKRIELRLSSSLSALVNMEGDSR